MNWICLTCGTLIDGPLTDDTTCRCDVYAQDWIRLPTQNWVKYAIRRLSNDALKRVIERTTAIVKSGELDSMEFDVPLTEWCTELKAETERRMPATTPAPHSTDGACE